jgi:hypothetical protein
MGNILGKRKKPLKGSCENKRTITETSRELDRERSAWKKKKKKAINSGKSKKAAKEN